MTMTIAVTEKGKTMRLIDADALPRHGNRGGLVHWKDIENAPTIVPVKHGRWLQTDAWPHNVYCSECHKTVAQAHWKIWQDGSFVRNYCPNCGAQMEVEKNEID